MDRRNFIASALLLGAGTLSASILPKTALAVSSAVDKHLSGVWKDPYLSGPSSILIESRDSGALVKVTGTYLHKKYGQSTFHGTGVLKGKVLILNYEHENKIDLGNGTLRMELTNSGKKLCLSGSCQKDDGTWSAQNMTWFKA